MLSTPGRSNRDRRARQAPTPRQQPGRSQAQSGPPVLPPYEPPVAPLGEAGRAALTNLLRNPALTQLKTHIKHAELKLTESVGEINERCTDAKARYDRERERARVGAERSMTEGREGSEGGGDLETGGVDIGADGKGNAEEARRLRELEDAVKAVTGKMDVSMRRAIDSEIRVDALAGFLNGLQGEVDEVVETARRRQRENQRRRTRSGRGGEGGDEDDEDGDEDDEDGDLYEATPEPEGGDEVSLTRKLDERMAQDSAKWEETSLTERYSKNNNYIGFYRIIHEAKHPGDDIPPLPHASTWFSHLEEPARNNTTSNSSNTASGPSSRRTTRQKRTRSASADSDDIAIESERISLKCPLTLLDFTDPVTSTKCPHSFERQAISDMIAQSPMTVPAPSTSAPSAGGRGKRIHAVKCPVCSIVLTADDLREDPVFIRRVRRGELLSRRKREEEEEAELELDGKRKRQGGIMLGSDDEDGGGDSMEVDPVRVKSERAMSRGITAAEEGSADDEDDGDAATHSATEDDDEEEDWGREGNGEENEENNEEMDEDGVNSDDSNSDGAPRDMVNRNRSNTARLNEGSDNEKDEDDVNSDDSNSDGAPRDVVNRNRSNTAGLNEEDQDEDMGSNSELNSGSNSSSNSSSNEGSDDE